MAAVWAAGPEPMITTLAWGGVVAMVGEVEVEVKVRRGVLVGGEKGEVVAVEVCLCCGAVEAARVKGMLERKEVFNLRRKAEENSLKVVRESILC